MATHKNWHAKHLENRGTGQRIADWIASVIGSWSFILLQTLLIGIWVGVNIYGFIQQWDPYPFVFLNLMLGVLASYYSPIIMMSQNRQTERDRTQAEEDFKTTLEVKKEIESIQTTLARLENRLTKATPKSKK